jgi:predicted AlkP superfamily phosphohydrolase/phosphomutase
MTSPQELKDNLEKELYEKDRMNACHEEYTTYFKEEIITVLEWLEGQVKETLCPSEYERIRAIIQSLKEVYKK